MDWVNDMVNELDQDRFFRWFDSGDMYSLALAEKILEVMRLTPWCKHWLPTRMYKFPKFALVLREMQSLDNVMVRFSSDSVIGEYIPGLHGSVIVQAVGHVGINLSLLLHIQRMARKWAKLSEWWQHENRIH